MKNKNFIFIFIIAILILFVVQQGKKEAGIEEVVVQEKPLASYNGLLGYKKQMSESLFQVPSGCSFSDKLGEEIIAGNCNGNSKYLNNPYSNEQISWIFVQNCDTSPTKIAGGILGVNSKTDVLDCPNNCNFHYYQYPLDCETNQEPTCLGNNQPCVKDSDCCSNDCFDLYTMSGVIRSCKGDGSNNNNDDTPLNCPEIDEVTICHPEGCTIEQKISGFFGSSGDPVNMPLCCDGLYFSKVGQRHSIFTEQDVYYGTCKKGFCIEMFNKLLGKNMQIDCQMATIIGIAIIILLFMFMMMAMK